MPLHRESETRRIVHAKRLDQAVGSARFHREPGTELVDALPVERVDLYAVAVRELAQHAAGLEQHVVSRPVLHLERRFLVLAVVIVVPDLVQPLPQRAAERHVHLLEPPAHREHRHPGRDRLRNHRQRGRVARRIVQCPGSALRALVVVRLDVGGASRQQQPVEALEQQREIEVRSQRRDDHGYRVRGLAHRFDVLLAHHVKPMVAKQATVRRYPNEGLRCTHVNYFKQPARAAGVQNRGIRPHPPAQRLRPFDTVRKNPEIPRLRRAYCSAACLPGSTGPRYPRESQAAADIAEYSTDCPCGPIT